MKWILSVRSRREMAARVQSLQKKKNPLEEKSRKANKLLNHRQNRCYAQSFANDNNDRDLMQMRIC